MHASASFCIPFRIWALSDRYSGEPQSLELALTYACISDSLFAFYLLSRTNLWALSDLQDIVFRADADTNELLDLTGIRFADESTYATCGMI